MIILNIGDCCLESFHYLPAACAVVCTLQKPIAITRYTTTFLEQRSNNTNNTNNHLAAQQLHSPI